MFAYFPAEGNTNPALELDLSYIPSHNFPGNFYFKPRVFSTPLHDVDRRSENREIQA